MPDGGNDSKIRITCLKAAISRVFSNYLRAPDNEDRVQDLETLLENSWDRIHMCWSKDGTIKSITGMANTQTILHSEDEFGLCLMFTAEAILWGARFSMTRPCGRCEMVGPFHTAIF